MKNQKLEAVVIKGTIQFRAHGVGKWRTRDLYLNTFGNATWGLPKKFLKRLFPDLKHGQDHQEKEVSIIIIERG